MMLVGRVSLSGDLCGGGWVAPLLAGLLLSLSLRGA